MKHLSESKVQDRALRYLHRKYRFVAKDGRIFSRKEVRTLKKHGGNRADGLVAFKHIILGTYVSSLEAKSYKTLSALIPNHHPSRVYLNAAKAGISLSILTGSAFLLFEDVLTMEKMALPFVVFLIGFILYHTFFQNNSENKSLNIVAQLKNYPANAQWVACSKDSLKLLGRKRRNLLEKICHNSGIGMLIVDNKGGVEEWYKAAYNRKWVGDFLVFYNKEKEIRKQIS